MASDRLQRQVDRLLDEAADAVAQGDWALVRDCSQRALVVDPGNQEALSFMAVAERGIGVRRTRDAHNRSDRIRVIASDPVGHEAAVRAADDEHSLLIDVKVVLYLGNHVP